MQTKTHFECILGGALRWDGGDELRLGGSPGGVALGLVGEHPCLLDDVLRDSKQEPVSPLGWRINPGVWGMERGGGAYGGVDDAES